MRVCLWAERRRISPGPADDRRPDCHLFAARHSVVRRCDSALHQPRAQPHQGERVGRARRTTQVPRHQVALKISIIVLLRHIGSKTRSSIHTHTVIHANASTENTKRFLKKVKTVKRNRTGKTRATLGLLYCAGECAPLPVPLFILPFCCIDFYVF